jgi:hypothetical protein
MQLYLIRITKLAALSVIKCITQTIIRLYKIFEIYFLK